MKSIKLTKTSKRIVVVLLFSFSLHVNAAEFCVSSSTELQNALSIASSNKQDDVIKVTKGFFETRGTAFIYDGREEAGWDLDISGAWTDFFDYPCGRQLFGNPLATTLDGVLKNAVLVIKLRGRTNLKVSNLGFINGFKKTGGGGGLSVTRETYNGSDKTFIENNAFIYNKAVFGAAVSTVGSSRKTYVRNNLFAANIASISDTVEIIQQLKSDGIYFTNNTVIYNATGEGNKGRGGVYILASAEVLVANNILLKNGTQDLWLDGSGDYYLKYNNVGDFGGNIPIANVGNFNLPPQFEPGILNFIPSASSPMVNAGTQPCFVCTSPVPFDEFWRIGDRDLMGKNRVQNHKPDIGAYESAHK
ncbi:hypothetical protein [Marinicella sp. W31]|uniref:hypothetical protein n=1 Tax=Marinicella sp. W31 TaxID=3023713 RepID=UPI0037571E45